MLKTKIQQNLFHANSLFLNKAGQNTRNKYKYKEDNFICDPFQMFIDKI